MLAKKEVEAMLEIAGSGGVRASWRWLTLL